MTGQRQFRYRLQGQGGFAHELTVAIDSTTLACVAPAPVANDWTALSCHQCPHCPLDAAHVPLCPLAARIAPLIEPLNALLSHDAVTVAADCGDRVVTAATTAQAAASSVMGLIGAVSGCPHTAFLRPMAWFHLPLASEEETVFRAAATYLLGQYFAARTGQTPDWELAGLKRRYQDLHRLNVAMAARLRQAGEKDAGVNAVVRLDMFAKAVPYSIDEVLDGLRPLYAAGAA